MNPKMYTLIALVVIVVALAIYFLMPKNLKITNIKTYTFPDGSFSFRYPEFEKWTSNIIKVPLERKVLSPSRKVFESDEVIIYEPSEKTGLVKVNGVMPQIMIEKDSALIQDITGQSNLNGVQYFIIPQATTVQIDGSPLKTTFLAPNFSLSISIVAGYQEGFSAEAVMDEIIKTFITRDK